LGDSQGWCTNIDGGGGRYAGTVPWEHAHREAGFVTNIDGAGAVNGQACGISAGQPDDGVRLLKDRLGSGAGAIDVRGCVDRSGRLINQFDRSGAKAGHARVEGDRDGASQASTKGGVRAAICHNLRKVEPTCPLREHGDFTDKATRVNHKTQHLISRHGRIGGHGTETDGRELHFDDDTRWRIADVQVACAVRRHTNGVT
jgi:hypothetical protein